MKCLQQMPSQCRYCNHFQPDIINQPCNLANGRESWDNVTKFYGHCTSFKPKHDHCTVCSLRLECLTEAENILPFAA